MATNLSPREVGGVLDQLYRAATGVPRRFYLRSEDLQRFAGRERALRPEFFEEAGRELELWHSILMSYPRLGRGGVLGFVSERALERWPAAPARSVRDAIATPANGDWAKTARERLHKLSSLESGYGSPSDSIRI